jgi:hypothetical protein
MAIDVAATYEALVERLARLGLSRRPALEVLDEPGILRDVCQIVASEFRALKSAGATNPSEALLAYGLERYPSAPSSGPQLPYTLACVLVEIGTVVDGYRTYGGYKDGETRSGDELTAYEHKHKLNSAHTWRKHTTALLRDWRML